IRDRNVTGVQTCALPIYVLPGIRFRAESHPCYLPVRKVHFAAGLYPLQVPAPGLCPGAGGLAGEDEDAEAPVPHAAELPAMLLRSEERRVGKECSAGGRT